MLFSEVFSCKAVVSTCCFFSKQTSTKEDHRRDGCIDLEASPGQLLLASFANDMQNKKDEWAIQLLPHSTMGYMVQWKETCSESSLI